MNKDNPNPIKIDKIEIILGIAKIIIIYHIIKFL
jgi:hypothetical protein